jgi:hypothetical protein
MVPLSLMELLALLLRIQKVSGSNLGPETGCPDGDFSPFFSVSADEFRDITYKLGQHRFLPNSF